MFETMNKEELINYINENEVGTGKYGLAWDKEKEPEKIVYNCEKYIPIVEICNKKAISDKNSMEENILIEGDNFHSLSVLNYTHAEKIDVIYIDPPYNTGNKDFIYNDKFVDYEDGYRHSKWLNFMEKRLKLSRNLLKDSGLIFISIDDNEYAQLKLLCDKIFSPNNFLSCVTIITARNIYGVKASSVNKKIIKTKEYLLVYTKNYDAFGEIKPLLTAKRNLFDSHYSIVINDNKIVNWKELIKKDKKIMDILKKEPLNHKNLNKIFAENSEIYKYFLDTYKSKIYQDSAYTSKLTKEQIEILEKGNIINNNGILIFNTLKGKGKTRFLSSMEKTIDITDDYTSMLCDTAFRGDVWDYSEDMNNIGKEGNVEFKNGKKPKRLIRDILKLANNKNSLVLDFFAGSGTTGHAVLDLNKEDGGHRQFILCTNNENNICEEITYQRLKNVMEGFSDKNGLGGNLKYLKTEFVNNVGSRDQLFYDLTERCIPMLCLKEETFDKLEENEEYVIYTNKQKNKYTCVYFDMLGEKYSEFKEKLMEIKDHKSLYIFTLGNEINESELRKIQNYTIEPIPYKILEIYKKIIRMSKEV